MSEFARVVRSLGLRSFGLASAASIAIHVVVALLIRSVLALPDIDGEFRDPAEIEFGIAEGLTPEAMTEPPAPASPAAEPEAPSPSPAGEGDLAAADAGPRRRRDAGLADAGVDASPSDASADAEVDAGRSRSQLARATERPGAMHQGAHVALRFDFARIRGTPLAAPISDFLRTIRDFQQVIGDSGLDPVNDLDQFLMASPNPWQRRKYIYLGRLAHDEAWARERVAAMAASRGEQAVWTEAGGVPFATWYDRDDVGRMIGLLGDRYFVLARGDDLEIVHAWLDSIAAEHHLGPEAGPGLALGVADDEVLSLEAENLPAYVAGNILARTPERARLSIVTVPRGFDLAVRADFADAASASDNAAYWDDLRAQVASNPLLFGMQGILNGIVLRADDERVRGESVLSESDARMLLDLAKSFLVEHYRDMDARQQNHNAPRPAP